MKNLAFWHLKLCLILDSVFLSTLFILIVFISFNSISQLCLLSHSFHSSSPMFPHVASTLAFSFVVMFSSTLVLISHLILLAFHLSLYSYSTKIGAWGNTCFSYSDIWSGFLFLFFSWCLSHSMTLSFFLINLYKFCTYTF